MRTHNMFFLRAVFVSSLGGVLLTAGCGRSDGQETDAPKTPAPAEEKTLEEICVEHACAMPGCSMTVKATVKPGERVLCPICGEAIVATSGKAVAIPAGKAPAAVATAPAGTQRRILFYRNPMDPQVTSPVPMKDPMGMDYVPVYEEASAGGPAVTISPERQQLIGIKTETVQIRDLSKDVRASGKIAYDPDLAVTQEEFIEALKTQEETKDSPLQDVIDRAKSTTDAARNKLRLLGMGEDQIAELEKTRKSETNLYLPAQGEDVWAYVSIYEYEIGLVKTGSAVEIEAAAYPGEKFTGRVVSINPVLDPATRTNQVRVEVTNTGDKLKPEMYVNAVIKADLGAKLAVPETAVLDTGLRKIVYLAGENNTLESREVTLGQKAGDYYEVRTGLKEGDVVVTSGNFLVDSESKLEAPSSSL